MFQSAYIFHDDPPTELYGEQAGSLPPETAGHQPGLHWGERTEGLSLQAVGHFCAGLAAGIIG